MQTLDGTIFTEMVMAGARHLTNNSKTIDALNVFPVPDGDTGTNMNLSMTSGVNELKKANSVDVSVASQAFAKGLLMGARGNSGVILSQIFRGFAKGFEGKETVTTKEMADAFDSGVETAYKAVMKPVEGTILTVAKDSGAKAVELARTENDIIAFMEQVLDEAKASLKRTPDLLPVLKEVGVVDSGGQGLVTIYEGFLASLKGEELPVSDIEEMNIDELVNAEHHKSAQDFMDTEDIVYGYCTEFMVKFEQDKLDKHPFSEDDYREELSKNGDSLVVISDDDVVKVHIHTEYPGKVMTMSQNYGRLVNIDIENMREQHTSIVGEGEKVTHQESPAKELVDFAVVTVAMGAGMKALFESLGARVVIEGGQTMNPSTQDITNAIEEAHAKQVLILPNNKNITMAAEQAAELAGEHVDVVPTKTIPQGISALLELNLEEDLETNKEQMTEAAGFVKTGQVTYAVRDTQIDGLTIAKGNFMGIAEDKIKASDSNRLTATKKLLKDLVSEDDEIITIIYGEDVEEDEIQSLEKYVEETYEEDVELDVYNGEQPIYSYIIAVE